MVFVCLTNLTTKVFPFGIEVIDRVLASRFGNRLAIIAENLGHPLLVAFVLAVSAGGSGGSCGGAVFVFTR